jgi:hypothetical protein
VDLEEHGEALAALSDTSCVGAIFFLQALANVSVARRKVRRLLAATASSSVVISARPGITQTGEQAARTILGIGVRAGTATRFDRRQAEASLAAFKGRIDDRTRTLR